MILGECCHVLIIRGASKGKIRRSTTNDSCSPFLESAKWHFSATISHANVVSPRSRPICGARWRRSFRPCNASWCLSMTWRAVTTTRAEVRFEIAEQDLPSYLRAADFLNITDVDVVCVEHEFGIFGGTSGQSCAGVAARVADAHRHDVAHDPARAQSRATPCDA